MEYRIVNESPTKIREIARFFLKGNWKTVAAGMFMYLLLQSYIPSIIDQFFKVENPMAGMPIGGTGFYYPEFLTFASGLYDFFLYGALNLGFSMFILNFFRKRETKYTLLMEGFSFYSKAFLLSVIIAVKTFLWSMLFVIPGIIATFRYSQAFKIMVDHPEYGIRQCIEESKRMMSGNKANYFIVSLSFVGWYFLATLPAAIFVNVFRNLDPVMVSVLQIVLDIPYFFAMAYIQTAQTAFYELITGKLVVAERVQ